MDRCARLAKLMQIPVAGLIVGGTMATPALAEASPEPRHAVAHMSTSTVTHATSRNWAGWVEVGGRYTSITASWRQPAVRCGLLSRSYSSFWVGLDGARSSTVEQTGTEADCNELGHASYRGWYEFYPSPPVYFRNRVAPGDLMSAAVTYRGAGRYTIVLRDTTRGWVQRRTAIVPAAQNSSAEVVAEAPTSGSGRTLALANFGSVRFSRAVVNGHLFGSVRTPVQLTMASGRMVKASVSTLAGRSAFTVVWRHR